jgi:hypothetical protein
MTTSSFGVYIVNRSMFDLLLSPAAGSPEMVGAGDQRGPSHHLLAQVQAILYSLYKGTQS